MSTKVEVGSVADVQGVVDHIASEFGDPEVAHIIEDNLYVAVLRKIVDGVDEPGAWAAAALKAQELQHERWCA